MTFIQIPIKIDDLVIITRVWDDGADDWAIWFSGLEAIFCEADLDC